MGPETTETMQAVGAGGTQALPALKPQAPCSMEKNPVICLENDSVSQDSRASK